MDKRKKIVYAITKSVWGGAQRYVYDLATSVPKSSYEPVVVAGGYGPLTKKLAEAGIRAISLPYLERDINIAKDARSLWAFYKIFAKEKPDIIHLNSSKAGGIGAIAGFFYKVTSRNFGVKIIFTVHGWDFMSKRALWKRVLVFYASLLSSLFQQKLILINSRDYNAACRFVPRRKSTLIHNGIKSPSFADRETARSYFTTKMEKHISPETIVIGTVAELTHNKGLEYLVDAAARLDGIKTSLPYHFMIIGDGEEKEKLSRKIAENGLEGKISLAGFIPDAARYLKGFDIFVLPSLKEGLPYVVLEAMAAGLPIIASDVGGLPDLIDNRKSGILTRPGDAEELSSLISILIENKEGRKNLGQAALQKADTVFSLESMVQQTIMVYESRHGKTETFL